MKSFLHARFSVAEAVVDVIYSVADAPDLICGEIIKTYAIQVFHFNEEADPNDTFLQNPSLLVSPYDFARLLFIVGHVALKHKVYLEMVESELKKKTDAQAKLAHKVSKGLFSLWRIA
jgi:condensin complex subunit 1